MYSNDAVPHVPAMQPTALLLPTYRLHVPAAVQH